MLFNYPSGLTENFNRSGAYMPGQITKSGWKLAPSLNTRSQDPRIEFGQVVKRKVTDTGLPYASAIETNDTADKIYGIAVRDVVSQSQADYGAFQVQYIYTYFPGQPITVLKEGYICVPVQNGTPAVGGKVYVRVAANVANANLPIGGIEAVNTPNETVELTGATFESGPLFPMNGTSTTPTQDVATSQCAIIFISK